MIIDVKYFAQKYAGLLPRCEMINFLGDLKSLLNCLVGDCAYFYRADEDVKEFRKDHPEIIDLRTFDEWYQKHALEMSDLRIFLFAQECIVSLESTGMQ